MDPTLYLAAGQPTVSDPEDFYARHGHPAFALWSRLQGWLRRSHVGQASNVAFADPAMNV